MATITDSNVYKSKETVCNNSMRNCVVRELLISGKTGTQISISKFSIDLANENDGTLTTCYITVESDGNEKRLSKWSNSKEDYTSRSSSFQYTAPPGLGVKVRVYLRTDNKNFYALAKNFLGAWSYIISSGEEAVESTHDNETEVVLVVKCTSKNIDSVMAEIQKVAPGAEMNT